MSHPLLTRAEMSRDGVLIALKAQSHEQRVKALEATKRSTQRLLQELEAELAHLSA